MGFTDGVSTEDGGGGVVQRQSKNILALYLMDTLVFFHCLKPLSETLSKYFLSKYFLRTVMSSLF